MTEKITIACSVLEQALKAWAQARGALAYVAVGNAPSNPNLARSTCSQAVWVLDEAEPALRAALEQPRKATALTEKSFSALALAQDTGPWSATYDGYGTSTYSGIQTQDGKMVALAVAHDVQPFSEVDSSPVARRLVACWNACQSLETEVLEQHALGVLGADHSQTLNELKAANQRLEAQRDQLLASLRKVSTCLNGWLEIADEEDQRDYDEDALAEANQVMQQVEGTPE